MGIAQWLEHWTYDWKVQVSSPGRSGRKMFFSRVNFLFWLLFQYPFHPCVTAVALAVAHKRSQSFCQKCWWQFTVSLHSKPHIRKVYVCLAVTCYLRFWQDDRGLLRATAVTQGWNGYRNKSQHRKLTLEKKILRPPQQGFEPATFRSRVRRSNHWATPAPQQQGRH